MAIQRCEHNGRDRYIPGLSNIQISDAGNFTLVATNSAGVVTQRRGKPDRNRASHDDAAATEPDQCLRHGCHF